MSVVKKLQDAELAQRAKRAAKRRMAQRKRSRLALDVLASAKRAAHAKEDTCIWHEVDGKPVAIVSAPLLERLIEQEEDAEDIRDAERIRSDAGQAPIPYAAARADLGLDDEDV